MLQIPHSDYKVMPWKNGLGVTAEIDRSSADGESYLWRLSQADIQVSSPFSTFPGYDRWLAVWRGNSIFLNDQNIPRLEPIRFSGDENTFCRLADGPVRDVGLIFNRAKVNAEMIFIEGTVSLRFSCIHYVFDVESGDTVKFDYATELSVGPSLLISVWKI